MARARAIIIHNNHVALIERRNSLRGAHYCVFPGGGIEDGETAQEAARREITEELGLHIEIRHLVAVVTYKGSVHHYFLSDILSGVFGTGQGEEMLGPEEEHSGSYHPLWFPITELPHALVYSEAVATIVVDAITNGWPTEPSIITED
jgi:8-oxo-dGTP pyrophosphatase MutT (NUDIX family)